MPDSSWGGWSLDENWFDKSAEPPILLCLAHLAPVEGEKFRRATMINFVVFSDEVSR
jgi:hypothetical protein